MKAIVQVDVSLDRYIKKHEKLDKKHPIRNRQHQLAELSKKRFSEYAEKYGHDHLVITEPLLGYEHPVWERLDIWFNPEWFEKYDEVLYVDTDVFPTDDAPDIFDHGGELDAFYRVPYRKRGARRGIFLDITEERYRETVFNAGVILINKTVVDKTLDMVKRYEEERFTEDSVTLNYAIMASDLRIENIDKRFNVKVLGETPPAYFYHCSGRRKAEDEESVLKWLDKRLHKRSG